MKFKAVERSYNCPSCGEALRDLNSEFTCDSCQTKFPIVENIPVFATAPIHSTSALSRDEVADALKEMDDGDWMDGLRNVLLRIDGARAGDAMAELVAEKGIVKAFIAGRPQDRSVLYLGCAAGAVPFALARRFPRVTVCDPSLGKLRLLARRASQEQYENLEFVCAGERVGLPMPTSGFDLVLVDTTALPEVDWSDASFWREVIRILTPEGRCCISSENPQSWKRLLTLGKDRNHVGFLNPNSLRTLLTGMGFVCCGFYGLLPDQRTPHLVFDLSSKKLGRTISLRPSLSERIKSRCFHNRYFVPAFELTVERRREDRPNTKSPLSATFVEGMIEEIENQLEEAGQDRPHLIPRRIESRGGGRLMILATPKENRHLPVIIKVPYQASAECADERNTEALRIVHSSDVIPNDVKALVPRQVTVGRYGGQPFFVEELVEGVSAEGPDLFVRGRVKRLGLFSKERNPSLLEQSGLALLELHRATARMVTLTESHFAEVRKSLGVLRQLTTEAERWRVWDRIEDFLERELIGQRLPLVWSHGDAGAGNFTHDPQLQLRGIVDWEAFDPNGLPLYDWVVLRVSLEQDEKDFVNWSYLRWALIGKEHVFFDGLPIDDYLTLLDLPRELIASLALAAWVQYAVHRLPVNPCNPAWTRQTIHDVLDVCDATL